MKEIFQPLLGPPGIILIGGIVTLFGAFWASNSSSIQQQKFEKTLSSKNEELAELAKENAQLNRDAVAAVNGGKGYLYLSCLKPHGTKKNEIPGRILHKVGKFPLRNVTMHFLQNVISSDGKKSTIKKNEKSTQFGDIRDSVLDLGNWDPIEGYHNKYSIKFIADNGMVVQTVELRKNVDGVWESKGRVFRWPDSSVPAPNEIHDIDHGSDVLVEWDWALDSANSVKFKKTGETRKSSH